MKRQRGRNRNTSQNNNSHNNNRTNSNRSMESNGPDVKVRGNVSTIYEKYTQLAHDAKTAGNRVKAESLRQHAEHYLRLMNEQEAAKEAEREAREARDAKRNERNDRGDNNSNQSNQRNDTQNSRNDTNNARSETNDSEPRHQPRTRRPRRDEETSEQPSARQLDAPADTTPTVVAEEKPKRRTRKPAPPKLSDEPVSQTDESEEKPKRRRRAPARPKDTDAPAAAE